MFKSAIRKEALQFRKSLTDAAFDQLNQQLLTQFKKLDLSAVKILHIFLPIAEKREPDTFLIISWLQEQHPQIKILVPRADFDNLLMTHHEYIGVHDLQKNLFNILEPQQGKLYNGHIDLAIIPLLGFDLKGNRVGYGKGFYDRFLTAFKVVQKIGLSLTPPIPAISDANVHDVLLDACITPDRIFKFR
jgi:5-formyltetrahydrofolate cyclo-ligase